MARLLWLVCGALRRWELPVRAWAVAVDEEMMGELAPQIFRCLRTQQPTIESYLL